MPGARSRHRVAAVKLASAAAIVLLIVTPPVLSQTAPPPGVITSVRVCLEMDAELGGLGDVEGLPDEELDYCGARRTDFGASLWNLAVQVTAVCAPNGSSYLGRPGLRVVVQAPRRRPTMKSLCRFDEAVDRRTWRVAVGDEPGPARSRRLPWRVFSAEGEVLRAGHVRVSRGGYERPSSRVVSSSDFDSYFNLCIRGDRDVWASGGFLHCVVSYPAFGWVRAVVTSTATPTPASPAGTGRWS